MIHAWLTPPQGLPLIRAEGVAAGVPRLETARCVLRAPRIADFPAYAAIHASPRWPHGEEAGEEDVWLDFCQMAAGWMLRGLGLWTVESRADGSLLGFVPLDHEWGDPEPEIGWMLTDAAEGQGYAFEAVTAARDHAFRDLGLATLVSYTGAGNARSIRLAKRLGAVRDPQAERQVAPTLVFRHPRPADAAPSPDQDARQ